MTWSEHITNNSRGNSKKLLALMLTTVLFSAILFAGCTSNNDTKKTDATITLGWTITTTDLVEKLTDELNKVGASTIRNAEAAAKYGLDDPETIKVMQEDISDKPWVISSSIVDNKTIVKATMPDDPRYHVGTDISFREWHGNNTIMQKAQLTPMFPLLQGQFGVSQTYPIFAENGAYLGFADIAYQPKSIIEPCITELLAGTEYSAWVAQTNGENIFDTSSVEIGMNILTQNIYQDKELQKTLRKIIETESGAERYVFWDVNKTTQISKDAIWDTVKYGDTKWRVVLTRPSSSVNQ